MGCGMASPVVLWSLLGSQDTCVPQPYMLTAGAASFPRASSKPSETLAETSPSYLQVPRSASFSQHSRTLCITSRQSNRARESCLTQQKTPKERKHGLPGAQSPPPT